MPRCLRCGAGPEWLEGKVPDEIVPDADPSCSHPCCEHKEALIQEANDLLDYRVRRLLRAMILQRREEEWFKKARDLGYK